MYHRQRQTDNQDETFKLPFEGKLCEDNRWVIMSELIPWSEFESEYAQHFSSDMGAPAKPFRMALGALIIKEKLGISDRETVEQIKENPYLQYFIGSKSYSNQAPFEASMMVYFRQRISVSIIQKLNQSLVKKNCKLKEDVSEKKLEKEPNEKPNQGKLLIDATVAPADIKYPTDVGLLSRGREDTERVIDILYEELKGRLEKKPRTYRKLARKEYLKFAKKRRPTRKQRRKAVKKQIEYIQRNLKHIDSLIKKGASLKRLSKRQYRRLLIVAEIYRQQKWMWSNKTEKIEDRIVSIHQPHIRPIVRGKAGANTEFGAKLSVSCVDGYVFLDRISWDNYNESGDLRVQVEAYKKFTGAAPESVHVDKIYRTRANRAWCKERGIRMSGPPLGRPRENPSREDKKQAREDEIIRNEIEGKFGQGKRRFSLNRVMAKLSETSENSIAMTFLVINLVKLLRQFYCLFLCQFISRINFGHIMIRKNYNYN